MKTVYINANLLYGECLRLLSTSRWKRTIRTGVLVLLRKRQYSFTTSILTRTEILQRLMREENCTIRKARSLYDRVMREYEVSEISSLNKRNLLTNTFMDLVAKANLDFKDALHLDIASKVRMVVVTHDKKFRGAFSQHPDKLRFYSRVVKPEELLND